MPDHAPPDSPGNSSDLMDLAVPYALDAVSDAEGAEIEQRLRAAGPDIVQRFDDTVCEVREAMGALSVLDAQPPPARVEARILAALDALPGARSDMHTGASTAGSPEEADPDDTDAVVDTESGSAEPESTDELARARRRRTLRRFAAAAAAVVVAVGVAVGIGVFEGAEEGPDGTISAQQVRDRPDARTSTVGIGAGILTVHTSAELGAATVSFDAVPAPPDGSDYQLWLIDASGVPRSAGVLPELPAEADPYVTEFATSDRLAVTLEPDGGSPAPTTAPLGAVTLG
ncbi:anti-sigma factor [Nocardia sp. NPDC024068]|uniref:anti-sigma factor n=1 Tax=Nocardia sp. NPDC024068 TaxID=3157197 RepID=UPI0033DB9AFE